MSVRTLRLSLEGGEASLGRVAARDVARMLLGVERAVARAAGHARGRQLKSTGRWGRTIEEATHFRLLGIERGSVIGLLELPDRQVVDGAFHLEDPSLSELAVESAFAVLGGESPELGDVVDSFIQLAEELDIGSRFETLTLETGGVMAKRTVRLDRTVRDRLVASRTRPPDSRDDSLVAVLVEADFEAGTARLRTPDGKKVFVRFDDRLADGVQEGLRRRAEFVGEVQFDPRTMQAGSIVLRRIVENRPLPLGLDPGDFWSLESVEDVARRAGVQPVVTFDRLREPDHDDDDEVNAFFAALSDS